MTEDTNLGFFKKSANAGIPYFHIFDGSICQRSKEERDGWERGPDTTNPQTKKVGPNWILRYDSIAAYIIDANRFKKEFTKEQGGGKATGIDITLLAGNMRANLQLNWGQTGPDPVLKRFLKVAPNIDLSKPLLISAFKNREGRQAVSFRQGDDPNPQKWTKVEEYWRRPLKEDGKPDMNVSAKGADGSVLPDPEHDEFNDTWDYKNQNNFLMRYFMENVEPKIKVIAAQHVTEGTTPSASEMFTGSEDEAIPEVTTKPDVVVAGSLAETATGAQRAKIRELSTQANFDFEAKCQEVLGCSFDELNRQGASFAIYKLGQMIASQGKPAAPPPVASAMAVPPPEFDFADDTPTAAAPVPAAPAQEDDDWGAASAPKVDDSIPWDE